MIIRHRKVIYDIECLSNLFTVTFYDLVDKKFYQFVIHKSRNDYVSLMYYMDQIKTAIGYNNLSYDYPVLHHLINHRGEYSTKEGDWLAKRIYIKSQDVISSQFSTVKRSNRHFDQIDVFKILGHSNLNRLTSLKKCEASMFMPNVQEMPIKYYESVSEDRIQSILSYNKLDVYATYKVLLITMGKTDNPLYKDSNMIELRSELYKKFGVDVTNMYNVEMGEHLLAKLYSDKMKLNYYDVIKMNGTPRDIIHLKDCIPDYVKFHNSDFNKLLNDWKSKSITSTKSSKTYDIFANGIKISCALGGIHGAVSGIFSEDSSNILIHSDVGSMYPSIAISNRLYPQHLGEEFIDVYDWARTIRLAEKRINPNSCIVKGFKEVLNGVFGKSNREGSFLFDPLFTMKITITGQLSLLMLIDEINHKIPEVKWINLNTDGLLSSIPKKHKDLYMSICESWCNKLKLELDHTYFSKVISKNVSSYIAKKKSGDIKFKGDFKIDKFLFEDPSKRIVAIALKEYFINNIPIRDTIMNHNNIYDFCLLQETKNPFTLTLQNGKDIVDLDRTTRYYISNNGGKLVKVEYNDIKKYPSAPKIKRSIGVNTENLVTIFNKYIEKPMSEYDINYTYYISECEKIINVVQPKQLTFDFW